MFPHDVRLRERLMTDPCFPATVADHKWNIVANKGLRYYL